MAPKDGMPSEAKAVGGEADTHKTTAASDEAGQARHRWRRYVGIGLIALLGPLAAIALGGYIYLAGGRYVTTDNAYIKSAKVAISADISGRVVNVAVRENQMVGARDLLFQIDPTHFRIALERAKARLIAARQGVEALRAVYKQKRAALERATSEVTYQRQQLARQQKLARRKLVSGLNLDTAMRNLRDAEDQVKVAEQELAEALAKLGGVATIAGDQHPAVLEAKAVRDQAVLDLKRATVYASVRGTVTNFDLQPGEYVRAGEPVFSLVGGDQTWVHANFKETALTYVEVGQRAQITVDTYPGQKFAATVAGISPATGAEFALLPPQNATGNWVKVVQRLTVRLRLDQREGAPKLRAGMSAVVAIDTKHQRELTGMFGIVAGWTRGLAKGGL